MPDLAGLVNVVFPVFTIAALAACALLYSVQTTLRANNGDLKERVGILEAEQKLDHEKIAAQAKQITAHQSEIETFSKIVTGEVHLVAITDLLTAHHDQAVKEWTVINGVLTRIDTTMAALLTLAREGK